jgi:hypothetical protein
MKFLTPVQPNERTINKILMALKLAGAKKLKLQYEK